MTDTPKGLATLALLKTRFDEGRDHLEFLEPFVADAVIHVPQESFLPQDIATQIRNRSNLSLPSDTIRTVLGRFSRKGQLGREGGRFFSTGELTDPRLDEARSKQETKNEVLADAFSAYAKKRGVLLSSDDALPIIAQFITDNKVPLLLDQDLPDSSVGKSGIDRKISRLVAAFITNKIVGSDDLTGRLQELTEGLVLQDTLLLRDVGYIAQRFRNLTILLDTPILLSALGLTGEANRLATAEFLSLVREAGAITSALYPTLYEMQRILTVYEDRLGRPGGHLQLYPTELTNHILTRQMAPSDIRTISAMLEGRLTSIAIQVRETPNRRRRFTLDEKALAEALTGGIGDSGTQRVRHDVDAIASVLTLRKGRTATSIERAGAIFCTTSGKVIKNGQKWYRDQGETGIPPIVHQYALSSIAWSKKPQAAYGIKVHELAALCRSALRPSRDTWDKFIVNLEHLCDMGEVTSDESVAVVASELIEPLLARVEDSGEPDADTFRETITRVIDKYRSQAAEESRKEVRKARREVEAEKEKSRREVSRVRRDAEAEKERIQEEINKARRETQIAKAAAAKEKEKWRSVEITATLTGQRVGNLLSWSIFGVLCVLIVGAALHSIIDLLFNIVLVGWLQMTGRVVAVIGVIMGLWSLVVGGNLISIQRSVSDYLARWVRDKVIQLASGKSR